MSDGVNPRIEVNASGKTWIIVPPRQTDKNEFVGWLKREALKDVMNAKTMLPQDDYLQMLREVITCGPTGIYSWSGPLCQMALKNEPGRPQILFLILLRNHADMTEQMAKELYEANKTDFDLALDTVLDPVPNSQPPGTPAESR